VPPEIVIAHPVVSLLLTMRASIHLDHQPRSVTIEIDDIGRERLLSSEMRSEPITAKLLSNNGFLGSHAFSQLGRPTHQFRISLFT
jgi:hypothetical protein